MNLQNGYKVVYEKAANGKRAFFASKTGLFADAEQIGEEIEIGKYKLIYEKDGRFFGSESGIPSADDDCFDAFDKVFKATADESEEEVEDEVVEDEVVETPEDPAEDGPTFDLPALEEEDEE